MPLSGGGLSEKDQDAIRAALSDFNLVVTKWRGTGNYKTKQQPGQPQFWEESVEWVWQISSESVGIVAKFQNSKFLKEGFMTYDLTKKQFIFKAVRVPNTSMVFMGPAASKDSWVVLNGLNPETHKQESIELRLLHSDVYLWNFKEGGKHIAQIRCILPEGFARVDTGPKCVVTGGLGTTQVTFEGKKYSVCCSGCAQAFEKNPEKFVREFEMKQKEGM